MVDARSQAEMEALMARMEAAQAHAKALSRREGHPETRRAREHALELMDALIVVLDRLLSLPQAKGGAGGGL